MNKASILIKEINSIISEIKFKKSGGTTDLEANANIQDVVAWLKRLEKKGLTIMDNNSDKKIGATGAEKMLQKAKPGQLDIAALDKNGHIQASVLGLNNDGSFFVVANKGFDK